MNSARGYLTYKLAEPLPIQYHASMSRLAHAVERIFPARVDRAGVRVVAAG